MTAEDPTAEELGLSEAEHQALDPNIRRELGKARAAARERDEATQRAQVAERELAITRAGIPDTPMGKFFADNYDGELTPEAIKAKATEVGVLGPAPESQPPPPSDLDAQRQLAQAGGQPPPSPNAASEYVQAIRAAKSPAEVMAAVDQYGPGVGVHRAAIT